MICAGTAVLFINCIFSILAKEEKTMIPDKSDDNYTLDSVKLLIRKYGDENKASYKEHEIDLIARYMYFSRKRGFIKNGKLEGLVKYFTESIRRIVYCEGGIPDDIEIDGERVLSDWVYKGFSVIDRVLYIGADYKNRENDKFIMRFFQAMGFVLIKADDSHPSISTAVTHSIAGRLLVCDIKGKKLPSDTDRIRFGSRTLRFCFSHAENSIIATLFNQYEHYKGIYDLYVVRKMFGDGYKETVGTIVDDEKSEELIGYLDELTKLLSEYIFCRSADEAVDVIADFELSAAEYFPNKKDTNFNVFCWMIPDEDMADMISKLYS